MATVKEKVDELYTRAGGKAMELMGSLLGQTARGVKENTKVSVDINAGPVTTSFAADATSVDVSTGIGLNIVGTATFTSPKAGSGPTASIGGLAGAGFVGGGSIKVGSDGVRGASLSAGVGVQLPAAASTIMKALGLVSVTVGEQKTP